MQTSNKGLRLIKDFEGLRFETYQCPAGKLTIGYGHTGEDVKPGMRITALQADFLLKKDLIKVEQAINSVIEKDRLTLTQNQFDALVSFAYNIGNYNFITSTLCRLLKSDLKKASDQFTRWVYITDPRTGKKIVSRGLVIRREKEKALFDE